MPAISNWGRRIDTEGLKDLFDPTRIEHFTATPGGIDNLHLSSIDTFIVAGRGEFEVKFQGYFRVARGNPTSPHWAEAEWRVNMIELGLVGEAPGIGKMQVRLNPDVVSPGQVFAAGSARGAAACRIAIGAVFSAPGLNLSLFNKEPILLMNDAIESVPPVEDPNGEAHIYRLPLFDIQHPDGEPIAYLTRLRYTVGNYLTKEQLESFRRKVI
jgi:hypothetical protein